MKELIALLDGREAGVVRYDRNRLGFAYADDWRSAQGAYPLSLSMPLAAAEHSQAAIEPFLWGLLPDNELILARWATQFQVSSRNAFALIANVGEDCAGAVQFVRPERRDELFSAAAAETDWLTEADVAERLRALMKDQSAWRAPHDTGQFSLAGAQPKTALLFDGRRWGVPSGRTPTTHILKPPSEGFDGHAENEHLCLALARALGLPAAKSEVRRFEDVTAIVVERYDRVRGPGRIQRAHQEDMCQALRVHPANKYQNDGGPGPKEIANLLRAHMAAPPTLAVNTFAVNTTGAPRSTGDVDVRTFIDALIFNWLIGGTDAHAKNYSILIGGGGLVRLAPLYDLASILAHPDIDSEKTKLAMKIGGEYRLRRIGPSQWRKLAADVQVDADEVVDRARGLAEELPDRLADEAGRARKSGLDHPVIRIMVDVISKRASLVAGA